MRKIRDLFRHYAESRARKEVPDDFSPEEYLVLNPDVAKARLNPFHHYVRHGKKEGRIYKSRTTKERFKLMQRLEHNGLRTSDEKLEKKSFSAADIKYRLGRLGFPVIKDVRPGNAYVAERKETVFLKRIGAGEDIYTYDDLFQKWSSLSISKILRLPRYYGKVDDFHVFEYIGGNQLAWSETPTSKGYGGEGIPLETVPQIIDLALDIAALGVQSDFYWRNFIFVEDKIAVVDWDGKNLSTTGTAESALAYIYLLMFKNRPWQAELIRQARARNAISKDRFRSDIRSWANKYISQFRSLPHVSDEIRRMRDSFQSEKGFEALWGGVDLFSLLDGARYHVFEELGQTKDHKSQIACAPKLAALRTDLFKIEGKRVLDVGCSSGWFMNEFLKKGASKVVGVDISKSNCSLSERILKDAFGWSNIKLINGDILDVNHEGGFDVIASISMFHYIKEKQQFFRKMHDLLLPGGIFVLETPVHEGKEDVVVWEMAVKRYVPSFAFVEKLGESAKFTLGFTGRSNLEERRVFHFTRGE